MSEGQGLFVFVAVLETRGERLWSSGIWVSWEGGDGKTERRMCIDDARGAQAAQSGELQQCDDEEFARQKTLFILAGAAGSATDTYALMFHSNFTRASDSRRRGAGFLLQVAMAVA